MTTAEAVKERPVSDLPPGMIEHNARTAIRDLIEVYGEERAERLVKVLVSEEAKR
jgi:hypothetical protein